MTSDLKVFLLAGAEEMQRRSEWLKALHADPAKATGIDVRNLIERTWGLEAALNDYYRECDCMAGLRVAKMLQARRPGPEVGT